jgi:MFS family permease
MTRGEHGSGSVAERQVSQRAQVTGTQSRPEKRFLGLVSVCLGFFVIQLDVTIVNVALPAIQREVGGSVSGLQWVIDAYTLALASVMLTAGSQADRIGARRVFTAGLIVFGVGSAACAAAPARPAARSASRSSARCSPAPRRRATA